MRGVARGNPARLVAALGELNAAAAEETARLLGESSDERVFLGPRRGVRRRARHRLRGVPRVRRASFDDDDWSSRCRGRRRSRGDGRRSRRARVTRARGFFPPSRHFSRGASRGGVVIPRRIRRGVDAARGCRSETRAVYSGKTRRRATSRFERFETCGQSRPGRNKPLAGAVPHLVAIAARPEWRTGRRTTGGCWSGQSHRNDASRCTRRQRGRRALAPRRRRRRATPLRPPGVVSVGHGCESRKRVKNSPKRRVDAHVRLLRGDAGRSAAAGRPGGIGVGG